MQLTRTAFSGSGRAAKGDHIVDPRIGRPVRHRRSAWALAPTATQADALSTALMIMSDAAIVRLCSAHPEFGAYATDQQGQTMAIRQTPRHLKPES